MSSDEPIEPLGPRAGFWRRLLAWIIDIVVVAVPFQIIAAILFAMTSGWIQQSTGITFTTCVAGREVPEVLSPPPPSGSNFARECRVFFFGAETARRLQVGRATKEGSTTKIVLRGYMLDRDGHPINGVSIDWLVIAVLIGYLFAMETRNGATLGDRATRIRVVDPAALFESGVQLRKIVTRYLVMAVGLAPVLAVTLAYFGLYGSDLEATAASNIFTWLRVAGVLTLVWIIILCVPIARKRDPLYDRIAGTAVVRASTNLRESEHRTP